MKKNYSPNDDITKLRVNRGGPNGTFSNRGTKRIDFSNGNWICDNAVTKNSYDQISEEIAEALELFQQVEEQELYNLTELIPELNQHCLFSAVDPPGQPLPSIKQIDVQCDQQSIQFRASLSQCVTKHRHWRVM